MEQQVKVEVGVSVSDDPSPQEDQKDPLSGKADAKRPLRKGPKKRTKTGCLTCRKRRIKCGEEKPICSNCKKSKRECEGYARPVIFKPLVGVFANYVPSHYVNGQLQPMSASMRVPMIARPVPESLQQRPAGSHQPVLAPRPIQLPSGGQLFYHPPDVASWGTAQLASMTPFHYPPNQMYAPVPVELQPSAANDSVSPPEGEPCQQRPAASRTISQITSNSSASDDLTPENHGRPHGTADHGSWVLDSTSGTSSRREYRSEQLAQASVLPHDHHPEQVPPSAQSSATLQSGSTIPLQYEEFHRPSRPGLLSPVSVPQVVYMDEETDDDDDYYDVDSDEEMADQPQAEDFSHLTLIMASADRDPQRLRSFTSYLNEPNILATYRPTFGSTPLNNPKTARIFVHFLHATGPSLSIFERHPSDATSGVLGAAVPSAQQGLWTYTLPLKALEHPALLQAMLAISSLQIASLQQAPPTVSIKHYNYALRRLRKAVGLPTRRKQIGTLAAALLLGYYEVVAAEHSKWNSHLAGSTHLIREVDFAGMTRDLRAHRRRVQAVREHHARQPQSSSLLGHFSYLDDPASEDDPFAEKEATIDEKLIGAITGRAVNYDEFGTVETGHLPEPKKHFTRKDIENFRIRCDLHWWYCKQDMIHSMISGNRLFLPYDHWGQCPPRAGVGRLDAVYGSFDHLILLLGRVTDFGARDRKRKIRAGRAAGCDWKPNPGYFKFMKRFAGMRGAGPPPPPTPAAHGSTPLPPAGLHGPGPPRPGAAGRGMGSSPSSSSSGSTANRQDDSPPMMYGMIPPRGPVQLPAGFSSNGLSGADADSSPDSGSRSLSEEADHDVSYNEAELEWESILAAFDAFTAAFGRDYMALPADLAPTISTPFGPALQYCTTTVSVLWCFYYAGRILLHRVHPSMPPATMIAAGVAAATTAEYAQIVGKIAAGIYYPQRYNLAVGSLSPTLGSSLTEMTVPIFFAAVQYMDAAQRGWTVSTLREITRLTGWKSATTIASGCENAWVMAAEKGKGPAYQRTGAPGPRAATEAQTQAQAQHHGLDTMAINNNRERRVIPVAKSHYVTWAWGILSLEDDLLNLELEDRVPNQY